MKTGRRSRGEILLLLVGLVLAAGVGELLVRAAVKAQSSKGGYSPVRGRRAWEPVNTAGYRDEEHTREKPAGVRRVVFVGDSFTYGAGVLLDDTYAKRTGRGLSSARRETWESIVLAVPGYDTEQEEALVEKEAFTYSPDLLVLGYVLNDAEARGAAEHRRAQEWAEAEALRTTPPWWRRSALLNLVAERLRAERENRRRIENHLNLYRDGAAGFRAAKRSLGNIAATCRERGVPFVVLLFPLFANPLDERYPFESIHRKVEAAARDAQALFVDTLPYYRDMDWHLLTVEGARDEHPNELAHRIAAQALLAALEGVPIPPQPRPPAPPL